MSDAKGNKPKYHARARQEPDSEYMNTIGAAWPFSNDNKDGLVVKLHSVPVNWNGTFLLVLPKED